MTKRREEAPAPEADALARLEHLERLVAWNEERLARVEKLLGLIPVPPGQLPPPTDRELLEFALERRAALPDHEHELLFHWMGRIRAGDPLSAKTRLELERIAGLVGFELGEPEREARDTEEGK